MCDTLVALPPATVDNAVYFAKNSDREPGEAQTVEHLEHGNTELIISRPAWMWGAEMGANARGVAIGNEAVFTKLPVAEHGKLGMDLLRLALEHATTAREALDVLCAELARTDQGGPAGYRNKRFRYHSSFLIADAREAWVLETAGRFWAAERVVSGVRTISNALSILEHDLLSPGAYEYARSRGWCRDTNDFAFARAFGDPVMSALSGARRRSACTAAALLGGPVDQARLFEALRSHAGRNPADGWRLEMPCAHASWLPTRHAGQTTGSMVSRLAAGGATHWLTGTSSPCLSVFKPVKLGTGPIDLGPPATEHFDPHTLWWSHELLHRLVLQNYEARSAAFDAERKALESNPTWEAHRQAIDAWRQKARAIPANRASPLFKAYWHRQAREDHIPAD